MPAFTISRNPPLPPLFFSFIQSFTHSYNHASIVLNPNHDHLLKVQSPTSTLKTSHPTSSTSSSTPTQLPTNSTLTTATLPPHSYSKLVSPSFLSTDPDSEAKISILWHCICDLRSSDPLIINRQDCKEALEDNNFDVVAALRDLAELEGFIGGVKDNKIESLARELREREKIIAVGGERQEDTDKGEGTGGETGKGGFECSFGDLDSKS